MTTDNASRAILLGVARAAIESAVRGVTAPAHAEVDILRERRGVFVTLRRAGALRGCIGRVEPDEPLASLLPSIAVLSATADPRFPRVSAAELADVHIEISLLTVPVLITGSEHVEIGRHGLIISAHRRRGLLLPQVATEYGWTVPEFLAQTCLKAGLRADAWQHARARIHAFETEIFGE